MCTLAAEKEMSIDVQELGYIEPKSRSNHDGETTVVSPCVLRAKNVGSLPTSTHFHLCGSLCPSGKLEVDTKIVENSICLSLLLDVTNKMKKALVLLALVRGRREQESP